MPADHDQRRLIAAAGRGDESAFARLVDPLRPQLHAHCYRMLGSVQDAEDALQDALLRAWKAIDRFEGRSSFKSWIYRIATNTSLDLAERRPKRVVPLDHGPPSDPAEGPGRPLSETVWVEPYPDEVQAMEDGLASPEAAYEQRESVELAFVAALQHLPPRQRAILILFEVLGYSAKEVAATMETTVASVNSALQRARKTIDGVLPDRSQQQTLREIGDERVKVLVDGYMSAWEKGDVDAVVAMLTDDASITMPPMETWFSGRDAAEVFLRDFAFARPWDPETGTFRGEGRSVRVQPMRVAGQLGFGTWRIDPERGVHVAQAIQVLTLAPDGRISEIAGHIAPELFGAFGLPAERD